MVHCELALGNLFDVARGSRGRLGRECGGELVVNRQRPRPQDDAHGRGDRVQGARHVVQPKVRGGCSLEHDLQLLAEEKGVTVREAPCASQREQCAPSAQRRVCVRELMPLRLAVLVGG